MKSGQSWIWTSLAVLAALGAALWWSGKSERPGPARAKLLVYCAAGIQAPIEAAARAYEKEYGTRVELQYGGSGTLLSNLRVTRTGDLFIAADESYVWTARSNGVVREILPIATMAPVIALRKGQENNIRGVDDLLRCRVALANPDAAAIGRIVEKLLTASGHWNALRERVTVFKPTVMDVANDVKLGTVDAGVVWDATVRGYPELTMVRVPGWEKGRQRISVGVVAYTSRPAAALHFARYLAAPEKGQREFERQGYALLPGDAWSEQPEVVLFSGGINRLAIEDTLKQFEQREGARITRVYNGCGILVAQMKAGQHPDAYFACDVSFMTEVTNLFPVSVPLAESDIVLLTLKGNPRSVSTLKDLGQPGLKVGIAHPDQSALGALTERMLRANQLWEAVQPNIKVQTPTADLLVNQMRAGALDVAVVYAANVSQVRGVLTVVPIHEPGALAVQPYGVRLGSKHTRLMERLQEALCAAESQERFEHLGFRWRASRSTESTR